jgi:hypothetical protein
VSAAWPFLVGRTRGSGYRVVVVPEFLADPPHAAALAAAARTVDLPQGTAAVRELRGLSVGPLCVVYRSPQARPDEWGLPGEGHLLDETGRRIRLAHGVVVRRSAFQLQQHPVAPEDLERAHTEVAEAFREFWQRGEAFRRRSSAPFELGAAARAGSAPLRFAPEEPWTSQGGSAPSEPIRIGRPAAAPPESGLPPAAPAPHPVATRRLTPRQIALVSALVAVLIVLVAQFVHLVSRPSTPAVRPTTTATTKAPSTTHPPARPRHSRMIPLGARSSAT